MTAQFAIAQLSATLILTHGKVWTGDPRRPLAAAVACRGSTVAAVGSSSKIGTLAGPGTRLIDVHGRLVLPGFNAVHAIGDRANHTVLDLFARAAERNGPRDRRFRIEHAQHLRPDDMARFGSQQVIASMQPYHAIDDGRWAERRIGAERPKATYAFRSLLGAGATLAFESDWFVAPMDPLPGLYAPATRRTLDGRHPNGWIPERKISVEDAIRAYTMGSAFVSFDGNVKGSIEPAKLADLVVLSDDILTMDPARIRDVKVRWTIMGGRVVYEH